MGGEDFRAPPLLTVAYAGLPRQASVAVISRQLNTKPTASDFLKFAFIVSILAALFVLTPRGGWCPAPSARSVVPLFAPCLDQRAQSLNLSYGRSG
jgi:hypothetical protein